MGTFNDPTHREEVKPPRSAAEICAILGAKVIGQQAAKERLSLLLSMHLAWDYRAHPMHPPPNAMVIGPTGSGKTFSAQVASAALDMPFLIFDATTLVPSGAAHGISLIELGRMILDSAGDSEKVIVFLDEFDKIAQKSQDKNAYWKAEIQKGLLKLIEGQLPSMERGGPKILFLAGGAFQDIEKLERERPPEVRRAMQNAPKNSIVPDDFLNFGFIPELVARLPAVIQFEPLAEEALFQILDHQESSPLRVWENHFKAVGKTLDFTHGFRSLVVKRAASLGMGARGLQQVIFPALSRNAFEFESSSQDRICVTEELLWKY